MSETNGVVLSVESKAPKAKAPKAPKAPAVSAELKNATLEKQAALKNALEAHTQAPKAKAEKVLTPEELAIQDMEAALLQAKEQVKAAKAEAKQAKEAEKAAQKAAKEAELAAKAEAKQAKEAEKREAHKAYLEAEIAKLNNELEAVKAGKAAPDTDPYGNKIVLLPSQYGKAHEEVLNMAAELLTLTDDATDQKPFNFTKLGKRQAAAFEELLKDGCFQKFGEGYVWDTAGFALMNTSFDEVAQNWLSLQN